jgi:hypothetical protein
MQSSPLKFCASPNCKEERCVEFLSCPWVTPDHLKGPQAIQVSRLSIVDLAGSERTKVAQTSGERLKEAGSINRSLMVLGQCLETLRSNQKRNAHAATSGGNTTPKLAVVPFRDSKLTELFQDFFAGNGRAVCFRSVSYVLIYPLQSLIVNVNPYDTGFDENSQVMKFSAIAREVSTVTSKTRSAERRRTVRLSLADESYDALFDILEGTMEQIRPLSLPDCRQKLTRKRMRSR